MVMSACQIGGGVGMGAIHTRHSVNSLRCYCFWSHTQYTIAAASYYGITLITFRSGDWVHTI